MLQTNPQAFLQLRLGRFVPVWIDDVKELEGFEVTRCLYLSLAIDASKRESPLHLPLPEGSLGPEMGQLGLLLSSLEAVVTGPAPGAEFEHADDFARLFDRLEEDGDRDFELGFLWLPNRIIEPALAAIAESLEKPAMEGPEAKGQVLRVEANLFLEALAASLEERVPGGTPFVERALESAGWALEVVRPSLVETAALLEFSRREVETAGRRLAERQETTDDEVLCWVHPEHGLMRGDRALGKNGDG